MTVTVQKAPSQEPSRQGFSTTARDERLESQRPHVQGDSDKETSYVLVLLTDPAHHKSMNSLRNTYFPAKMNKIPAHLTLFHALPGSKLEEEVIPAITEVIEQNAPYRVKATGPFNMKRGIGIGVADDIDHPKDGKGSRNTTHKIHAQLRERWKGWLSDQDSGNLKLHYTVMNKVNDDKAKDRAFNQLKESFQKGEDVSGGHFRLGDDQGDVQGRGKAEKWHPVGEVLGLMLYKYEHTGHWVDPTKYKFKSQETHQEG